jgi:hypothetical protein
MFRFWVLLIFILYFSQNLFSQVNEQNEKGILFKKETSGFISAQSNGIGIGYRTGKFISGTKLHVLDFSLCNFRDLSEIRTQRVDRSSKSYFYGKLIYFYPLRGYYGLQKTLASKPYWGGVEIRSLILLGGSLGLAKPVFLYVLNSEKRFEAIQYEKDIPQDDIGGRAPFSKGLRNTQIIPGISLKTALNFEFNSESEIVRALEFGFIADAYLKPVQIMAFKPEKNLLFSIYLSYHFGRRFNP